jgi:hypothetical protein
VADEIHVERRSPPSGPAERNVAYPALRDGLRYCVVVFLVVRVGLSLLSVVGTHLIEPLAPVMPPGVAPVAATAGWHNIWDATERSDAFWFEKIADDGYREGDASAAFFPLYPAAMRAVSWIFGGSTLVAGLVVSNGTFLAALVVLYGLTTMEFSESVAKRSVVLMSIFPTAFFFMSPYAEAPFLLFSVSAFWFARRDRWLLAALAGALAALTRSIGIVLVPALAVEAFLQWRQAGKSFIPRLNASLAVVVGPLLYLSWWQLRFRDLTAPFDAQSYWGRTFDWPWMTVVHALRQAWDTTAGPSGGGGYWLTDVLVAGSVIVAVAAGVRLLRPSYLVFAAASLIVPLSYPYPGRPFVSLPRFAAVVFPATWVIAKAIERRPGLEPAVVGSFAALYGVFVLLFVNWHVIL